MTSCHVPTQSERLVRMLRRVTYFALLLCGAVLAQEPAKPTWNYSPDLLRPFWEGDVVEGESVLFIKDEKTGEAKASVLFPVQKIVAVRNSVGDVTYEAGKDFVWKPESREIVLPVGSRIVSRLPQELRRPAKSQKYELTHRDGNGEIFFAGRLEYAEMQTCITYSHAPNLWKGDVPKFDPQSLPLTTHKLVNREPLSIVVLGDSISTGANASAVYDAAPFQPAYPELLRRNLAERFKGQVELKNFSVGGTDTGWGLTQIDKVVEAQPHLVILAFGMNDSGGRSPQSYQENTKAIIAKVREKLPKCEFVLVASMLANRGWVRLKHEFFTEYRDGLKQLCEPGIALADVTSIWSSFLELKQDWDQTGNGVNHPNDFGHRVYAQVLSTVIAPDGVATAGVEPPQTIEAGPLKFIEQRLLSNYTYSYACAAADLDGDGDLDLTSSDAEPNSNLYLLLNDGKGNFKQSFIQKYAKQPDQPIRLERHAIGDINRDGRPDVVIVDNILSDIRWFENPGKEAIAQPWKLYRVAQPREIPGSYDVALADIDGDGDLDVAASSWVGKRFDWFENIGSPGNGDKWTRHEIENDIGETRTIAIADFNRDGKPDLLGSARTTNQIVWYANSGKPATEPWKMTVIDAKTVAPTHGHPVDLDGDGDLDVLMAFGLVAPVAADSLESHQVAWYENVGKAGLGNEWKKHTIATGFLHGFEAVAGDLDGDGDLDVVATGWGSEGRVVWFENTGDPQTGWKGHPIKQNWSRAVTVILADLDNDGRLDIVASAERGANELRWWRNGGPSKPLFVTFIGGFDSEPTPDQIAEKAPRGVGNSGMFQLAADLRKAGVTTEYYNWNGTTAGKMKDQAAPLSKGIAERLRKHHQEHPTDRLAIVGNSWGGHTAWEVSQLLAEEPPLPLDLVVFLDPSSVGRFDKSQPEKLPSNLSKAITFATRNALGWKKLANEPRAEFIDLGDSANGFLKKPGPAYDSLFDVKAHIAVEWDAAIHKEIQTRLLKVANADQR